MVNIQSCVLTDMLMVYICLHSFFSEHNDLQLCLQEALGGLSYATNPEYATDVHCCGQQRGSDHKAGDMILMRCATAARQVLNINSSRVLMPNEAQRKQHTCQHHACPDAVRREPT
jgi:hypothetical protein